ncbi:dihydrodipicolinate synthetase [Beutenbergia cavernae DSM 12333]|uniref:Dihydrodipicolinate synthetase n=1 Tax=Beutenbergia cavernae (strain ATCC BAA-8 / DSM 12333 / CCUG 43141 / JCM 11478 / NBRC 16432 / NCIMB 13614 / HKI 0122) TaxID=471853 RepID=C5C2K7_BEUC1|nr:dihydrodipicolinate synthase family protein [Beutenbergia cavernae]ACQ79693.1 dihydrodipicolinate synthetase [Beutenbergia cavernae DSM 12333]
MTQVLHGVIPPMCTPLTAEGDAVDDASLRRLVDHLVDGGVHGLFVLGTTGEVTGLTDAQREQVLRVAVEHAAGRAPVLAGAIDTSTARVADQIRRAQDAGADVVVVTAPFYAGTHPAEIRRHFEAVARVATVPVVAYDIPSRVGTKLRAIDVADLAEAGAIVGVKDSSGSDVSIRALLAARRERDLRDFAVFTGSELTVDYALALGADGVVPGLGNVDPAGYRRLYDSARSGDVAAARAEQDRLFELFAITSVATTQSRSTTSAALGAFKAALVLLGVLAHGTLASPGIAPDADDVRQVRRSLEQAGLIGGVTPPG